MGPGSWGGGGTAYPAGGRGFSEASGRSAPLPRLPGGGPLSSTGGSVGTVAGWALQRGFPADSGGGARLSLKKVEGKNTRGKPLDPGFMARSLSLARFGVCATLSRSWGYFAAHLRTLIWGLSFIKCFFSIFFRKMRPKSVLGYRRKQPLERIRDSNRQNERARASGPQKRGGGGLPPRLFASGLSPRESLDPPPGTGREPTSQVWTCAGPSPAPLPPRQAPSILLPSYQKAGQMTTSGNGWPAGSRPGRRFLAC